MKLGSIFFFAGLVILYQAFQVKNPFGTLIVANAGVSLLGVGASFLWRSPKLLLKSKSGLLTVFSWIIFWPYHFLNYFSLATFRLFSSEAVFHEIMPGLFLGCRPFRQDQTRFSSLRIASVLDLTSEFSEVVFLRQAFNYLCIPLLDTTAPTQLQLEEGVAFIERQLPLGPVYVHCALGHGRSATFIVGYLLATGIKADFDEAIRFVESKRPGVKLKPDQLLALKKFKYD
jgi:protein-tyrosine phosphatase